MVTVGFYFDKEKLDELLVALLRLPKQLRPEFFSESESLENKDFRADELSARLNFVRAHKNGFFLIAEEWVYQFFLANNRQTRCIIHSDESIDEKEIDALFDSIDCTRPAFGFACDREEYEHRNRLFHTIGENNIETWVGRDIERYVPGLYWYTFLSNELADRHGISLAQLCEEAINSKQLQSGNLLQFFEDHKRWLQHTERLDRLCESTEGLFSAKTIDAAARRAKNYKEYSIIVDQSP